MNSNLYFLEQVGRQICDERIHTAEQVRQARLAPVRHFVRRAVKVATGALQPA